MCSWLRPTARLPSLAALAAALLPAAALAQTRNLQGRALGEPAGIAVPDLSVAGAEEPTALEVNPAGTGFVAGPALQYFHEGREDTGLGADGFWLALPLGPLVPALSMQWIRPADGGGPRFRKTTFGLSLSDHRTIALGIGWNGYSSPDAALDQLGSFDLGFTLRPWRHLSIGFTARDLTARIAGRRLPVHYDLGLASRAWDDRLTLSADLLTNDQAVNDLLFDAGAVGLGVELYRGLAIQAQLQFPLAAGRSGPAAATYGELALTWNGAHAGITVGAGGGAGAERTWLVGARASAESYRSAPTGKPAPRFDLAAALSPPRTLIFTGERDPYGALLERLAAARDDVEVPAVVVRVDSLPVSYGRVDELRRLLLDVRARKPVVAYLVGGGLREYYLASAASVVLAPPAASLFPLGVSMTTPFLQEGLSKLGVGFDVVAVGRYKNAPDPLVRRDMSPAQREVTDRLLDDLYGRMVHAIAEARGLDEARVRQLIDTGAASAEEARGAKLIDAVAWPDDVEQILSARLQRPVHVAGGFEPPEERAAQRWGPRPAVGLIRVEGTIAQGRSREPFGVGAIAGSDTIAKLIQRAVRDRDIAAIVVRIESPGGDGLASDLIWRELEQARRARKPVVVSMGDVAASGGYLIAMGADLIFAEPSTLTGSIGVFALKPDLSGLLGKIGVNVVTLKRGEHADLESFTHRWSDAERGIVQKQIDAFYAAFVGRVADGRHLSREAVEAVAGGQVWTGAQARERGLVDRLGSLEDAIAAAQALAGYPPGEELELVRLEQDRGLLGGLGAALAPPDEAPLAGLLAHVPELRAAAVLMEMGPIVALPPSWLGTAGGSP
jgi:protease-4